MDSTRFFNHHRYSKLLTIIWFLEFISKEFYGLLSQFQLHSSKRFFFIVENDAKSYFNANYFCESKGATLAVPISDEENDDIAQLLPGKNIWLGVSGYTTTFWSGTYWTSNLNNLMYSNWRGGDGSPNEVSGNGKSNAFISQSDGTNEWITASENEEHYIVCIFRI